MQKQHQTSSQALSKDGVILSSPKETATVGTNTQMMSIPVTKTVGKSSQQLKVSCFPVPPLLTKAQISSEKIDSNNRMIQEILIESKRGNQGEQQNQNLQGYLMQRVKNGSFARKIAEVAANQKDVQFEEQTMHQWDEEHAVVDHASEEQISTPRNQGKIGTKRLLFTKIPKQHPKNHQQSFKITKITEQENLKRVKTPASISISTRNKRFRNGITNATTSTTATDQTQAYQRSSDDFFMLKPSNNYNGNASAVELLKDSANLNSTGKRNIHSTEKTRQIHRLSEIVRVQTKNNPNQQKEQEYLLAKEHASEIRIIPSQQLKQTNQSNNLENRHAEEGLASKRLLIPSQKQQHDLISFSSRSTLGRVSSSQCLNVPGYSSSNQITLPSAQLGYGGKKFNQSYQDLHKILLKDQNIPKNPSIQIVNSLTSDSLIFPLSPSPLVPPKRGSIQQCFQEVTRSKTNSNQNRSSLRGFDEQFKLQQKLADSDSEYCLLQLDDHPGEEHIQQYEQQYESLLKKDVSWALGDAPSSKVEVVNMKLWLQSQLRDINEMTGMSKEQCMIGLLRLSTKELIRQVSLECSDRGDMIKIVMRQSMKIWSDRLEQQKQEYLQANKRIEDNILHSHSTYQQIFTSKDKEIEQLQAQLHDTHEKLTLALTELEDTVSNDKKLRVQINKLKDVATYLRNSSDQSHNENLKLRQKINKVNQIRTRKEEMMREAARLENRFAQRTGESIIYGEDYDSNESSINSDLFDNKHESKLSEKQINLGGVQETIENLNYVPFTNPDDIKKLQGEQTQTGISLLLFGQMCDAEVQTDLAELLGNEFDVVLSSSAELEKFISKVENNDAQVHYFKQREYHLLEEIEALKNRQFEEGMIQTPTARLFPSNPQSNVNLDNIDSPKGENDTVLSQVSYSSLKRKKVEEVDNVLTEKYKNIMEKLNIENKASSSSSSLSDASDDENSEISSKKRNTLLKTVQAKIGGRQLGQKINQVESLFNDVGKAIVDKVKKNKYPKFRNFMPLPTLLKQINLVYLERMKMTNENGRVKEQECSNFTYYFLTKLYGFKKIVDQKFIIFILSVKKYSNILRVNLFARFLGLLDGRNINFSLDEYNKYIEVLNFVFNISIAGQAPSPYDIDSRYLVPFIRVMAFVGTFADTRMTFEENNEFRKAIESLKEIDPRGAHSAGIIDFDVFLNKMLDKYRQLVNRAKTYVINAFAASDLDGNGVCNLDEFLILNRHIETDLYDEEVLTQIFYENADKIIEGESNLSFDKFAVVCVDYNLFSDEAQDRFLGIRHKREIDFKMQELQSEWIFRERELRTIFEQLILITAEQKRKWLEIISVLSGKLKNVAQGEQKPLLIAYKILHNEAKLLVQLQDESRKDEELLANYEKIALKEQKEYQQHIQQEMSMSELSSEYGSPSPNRASPRNLKYRNSLGNNQLKVPGANPSQRLSIYSQIQSQIETEDPVLSAPPTEQPEQKQKLPSEINIKNKKNELLSLVIPQSSKKIPPPPADADQSLSQKSIVISEASTGIISVFSGSYIQDLTKKPDINLNDANFIELMVERLKNVPNKEKFLQDILLKNGVNEITEAQGLSIKNILQALESGGINTSKNFTAKQLLFQFFMKIINKELKTQM